MESIVHINTRKTFNIESARRLLPVVFKITDDSYQVVKNIKNRQNVLKNGNDDKLTDSLNQEIDLEIKRWNDKLEKLGVIPNGLWVADFDNGEGYFCWKYPETELKFAHGYEDGFSGRRIIK